MATSETVITVAGVTVRNPRGQKVQAVMFVRWPFRAPRTLGGVPVIGHFGGTRAETIHAGVKLANVIDATRRHGGTVLELHTL